MTTTDPRRLARRPAKPPAIPTQRPAPAGPPADHQRGVIMTDQRRSERPTTPTPTHTTPEASSAAYGAVTAVKRPPLRWACTCRAERIAA